MSSVFSQYKNTWNSKPDIIIDTVQVTQVLSRTGKRRAQEACASVVLKRIDGVLPNKKGIIFSFVYLQVSKNLKNYFNNYQIYI
jgi:hypothetical protein